MAAPLKPTPATAADLGAIAANDRLEIVAGTIVDVSELFGDEVDE